MTLAALVNTERMQIAIRHVNQFCRFTHQNCQFAAFVRILGKFRHNCQNYVALNAPNHPPTFETNDGLSRVEDTLAGGLRPSKIECAYRRTIFYRFSSAIPTMRGQ